MVVIDGDSRTARMKLRALKWFTVLVFLRCRMHGRIKFHKLKLCVLKSIFQIRTIDETQKGSFAFNTYF